MAGRGRRIIYSKKMYSFEMEEKKREREENCGEEVENAEEEEDNRGGSKR